jgi:hypothetical protein
LCIKAGRRLFTTDRHRQPTFVMTVTITDLTISCQAKRARLDAGLFVCIRSSHCTKPIESSTANQTGFAHAIAIILPSADHMI